MLDALQYFAAPHGGIAIGFDRVAMLMTGAESVRDVIAFPKTQRTQDLRTSPPTAAAFAVTPIASYDHVHFLQFRRKRATMTH